MTLEQHGTLTEPRGAGYGVIDGRRLTLELERSPYARRWLAHDLRRATDSMVYVFDEVDDRRREALWRYLEQTVGKRRGHTLAIDSAGRERGGVIWASTAYPGNQAALVTLESLRRGRGGRFAVYEVARAIEQVLDAVSASHAAGWVHGAISGDEVLVTPRGTLLVEMYGLGLALAAEGVDFDEARREEVRSVAGLAWRLLTGTEPSERDVFAAQARRTMDRDWFAWVERGLDPLGFAGADEAMGCLPGRGEAVVETPAGRARGWLGRLSVAVRREPAEPASRKKQDDGRV